MSGPPGAKSISKSVDCRDAVVRPGRCPFGQRLVPFCTPAHTLVGDTVTADHCPWMRRDVDQRDRQGVKPARPQPATEQDDVRHGHVEAIVESLQRTAGNAAVSKLLDGERLPPSVQAAGERRLGADLADVRVHSDADAATLAESVHAEAVTIGRDVFMGPSAGGVETSRGRKTLLHELAHTAQATGTGGSGLAGVSGTGSSAEREASAIASGGFGGPMLQPTQAAPAGVVHRKVADEEELEEASRVTAAELLDPKPLTEKEEKEGGGVVAPKAGELGASEEVAFEIRVLAPFRRALAAAMDTEWETAVERMSLAGDAMWEYEEAYAKRDPAIAAELRGIRGWLALAVTQMRQRYSGKAFSDGHIQQLIEESIDDLEKLGPRLGASK